MENLTLFKLHLNICWLPLRAKIIGYHHYVSSVYFEILLFCIYVVYFCFYSRSADGTLDIGLQIHVKIFKRTGIM